MYDSLCKVNETKEFVSVRVGIKFAAQICDFPERESAWLDFIITLRFAKGIFKKKMKEGDRFFLLENMKKRVRERQRINNCNFVRRNTLSLFP